MKKYYFTSESVTEGQEELFDILGRGGGFSIGSPPPPVYFWESRGLTRLDGVWYAPSV